MRCKWLRLTRPVLLGSPARRKANQQSTHNQHRPSRRLRHRRNLRVDPILIRRNACEGVELAEAGIVEIIHVRARAVEEEDANPEGSESGNLPVEERWASRIARGGADFVETLTESVDSEEESERVVLRRAVVEIGKQHAI